ncbi:type 2 periplasmic-binding domain-containing protein [Roseitranquillus sediminis]|uniref:transporter substrate-binding domain-containing protein n=1 Tax=Roseitranquillus sediminis TaxID=2809051 RepID=UPI001D0CBCCF|nr:transporter substrate-binding domain-containing protein [Roseitranquillus sediminis]MBM9594483.1 transporter substrate-binding domain-containing protein [Roseitranquillus sediminis]
MGTFAGPADAQLIGEVDRAQLESWRRADGNKIGFCQFDVNLTNEFDRAVAEEIAARLLLDSEFVMLGAGYGIDGEGLETDLFRALINDCDVVLGFHVGAGMYAPEFTVTRPYVAYDHMMIAADPDYQSLEDVPSESRIGTMMASPADLALARYIATRAPENRWNRLPYGRAIDLVSGLGEGTIEAALIFGPVFATISEEDPEATQGLHPIQIDEAVESTANIGGLMLAKSSFLRLEVDRAIESMIADGTIGSLLEAHGFGSIPAVPGGV